MRPSFTLIIILLMAFFTRLLNINDIQIDHDEFDVYQKIISRETLWQIPVSDARINHHIPALFLAKATTLLLGDNLLALRWPSICFSLLTVGLIFKLGEWLVDRQTGLSAAILLTFNPFALAFTYNSRGYMAMMFYVLCAYFIATKNKRHPQIKYEIAISLLMAMAIYNNLYAALAWTGLWCLDFPSLNKPYFNPRWFLMFGGSILVVLFLFIPIIFRFAYYDDLVLETQKPKTPPSALITVTQMLSLEAIENKAVGQLMILSIIGLAIASFFASYNFKLWLAWSWFLSPLAIYHLGHWFILPSILARPRYFTFVLPFLLLLLAIGNSAIWQKTKGTLKNISLFSYLPILFIVFLWLPVIQKNHFDTTNGNWISTARYLATHIQPTDLILCEPFNHDNGSTIYFDWTQDCVRVLSYWLKATRTPHIYPILTLEEAINENQLKTHPELWQQPLQVWVIVGHIPLTATLPLDPTWPYWSNFGQTIILPPPSANTTVANTIIQLERLQTLAPPSTKQSYYEAQQTLLKTTIEKQ